MDKADYGLDAPGVVRNLGLGSVAALALYASVVFGFWSGAVTLGPVTIQFAGMALVTGLICAFQAAYMVWSSKTGKLKERDRLLDEIKWTGNERALDVGCGRGLLLIGAAKRGASAVGLDLWQASDLSGNNAAATMENAKREGVEGRIKLETGDMKEMSFPDASFDVAVSMAAIHNIYDAPGRKKAIAEIARVLKPGGYVLIDDIRHIGEYEAALRANGVSEVRRLDGALGSIFFMLSTFGSLRPGQLLARKP